MTYQLHRKFRFISLSVMVWACAAVVSIHADDDSADADDPEVVIKSPKIPERNIVFEESDQPLPLRLFAADPALIEQKYVASFSLGMNTSIPRFVPRSTFSFPPRNDFGRSEDADPLAAIHELLRLAPEEKRPAEDIVSLLTDRNHVRPTVGRGRRPNLSFQVMGKDAEQVKSLSLALIDLYDVGLWYRAQQQMFRGMNELKNVRDESKAQLTIEQGKVEALSRRLADLDPITNETMNNLKTQQRLALVDMAAAQARIDACAKILERADVRGKPIAEEVESIKIAAEIELVGLAARREAVDQIVRAGSRYRELQAQLISQRDKAQRSANRIAQHLDELRSLNDERQRFRPLPLIGDVIPIQPIQWESGPRG